MRIACSMIQCLILVKMKLEGSTTAAAAATTAESTVSCEMRRLQVLA
jgi:hypothetical protein